MRFLNDLSRSVLKEPENQISSTSLISKITILIISKLIWIGYGVLNNNTLITFTNFHPVLVGDDFFNDFANVFG